MPLPWEEFAGTATVEEEGPWKEFQPSAPSEPGPWEEFQSAPVEAAPVAEVGLAVDDVRELAKRKALRDYGPPLTPEEEVTLKKAQGRSMMNALSAGEYKAPALTPEQQRHAEDVVNTPRLDVAEPQGVVETMRRALTPLLGPTEKERTEEMVPWGRDEKGNQLYVYKPLGNRLEQEQGLMTPFAKVEPMASKEDDTALGATGKAVFNTAAGLVNSVLSPAGAMLPVAGQVPAIGRTVGGAFAADMATHIPEQLVQMTEGKTLQEQIEGGLGAATSTLMALAGGSHAAGLKLPAKPSNAGAATEATSTKSTALDPATPAPLAEPAVAERAAPAGEALVTETAAPDNIRPREAEAAPPLKTGEVAPSPLVENAPVIENGKVVRPEIAKARELFPEQADVTAPKLDVRRSPFALGISPDNKAVTWLSKNVKRLFTATGDLPKETFESWIDRNGFVKAESRQTAYATRDLYNALKDEFKISTTETLTKGFEKVPPAFVKEMNRALLGEVDINTLPEKVRAPLQAMRSHIDALSQRMLDEGVVPASLQAKVAENMSVYMARSYRIFDDPVWAEKIPNDVRNRARDFIHSNLKKTDPTATPETANAVMQSMLQDWKDQGSGALVKSGGKIGSKDLTSFIARKDIPKVLRELMGEYGDPTINYARSVTKMANLIGSQRFLTEVKAQGTGKFLFEDGKQPASHSSLIAAEGSDVMAPLNGLRTTPEIAAAFKEFGKSDPIKNPYARAYFMLSGLAKASKTVGSAMTQARNVLGQAYFFGMNGHFDMRPAAGAVKAVLADLGARDTPEGRAAYQRYLRLGIVDQSAKASELRDIIRDTGLNDPGTSLSEPGAILAKTAKKLTVDAAARAYQVADDLGKIIGFENELVRQREIHPEWSEATLEGVAAERIRNTYPTYSSVPKAVKNLRVLPVAPFASFASETFRTAYHNLRYTIEDLHSSNPAQKKAGAQRIAGQLAVVGSGYALSAISQAMLGMNAQDEDDARRFMAPWDKDSQIMFTGKNPGQARYINLSYTNPYSYLTDPVISVASGLRDQDQLDEVMLRSMEKLFQPFASEDILGGVVADIARNKTKTGGRVYNPGDTPTKRWEDKAAYFYKALEPGTLTRVKGKIIPAIKGETDRSGRKPELSNEILNELTGFKQQTIDYAQGISFRANDFKKADDDADTIFREVAGRRGSVKPDDIADAYKRATRSKFEAWQSFYRDVEAARRRGVSDGAIRTAVEARGVSGAEAGAVMSGKFIPPRVSPSLGKQMKDAKRSMPAEAAAEMKRAEKLVLSGSF